MKEVSTRVRLSCSTDNGQQYSWGYGGTTWDIQFLRKTCLRFFKFLKTWVWIIVSRAKEPPRLLYFKLPALAYHVFFFMEVCVFAWKGGRNLHATRHTHETCRFGLQSVSAGVSKCCLGLLPAIPFFLAFFDIELDSLESNSHSSCLCVDQFCVCDMDKTGCLGEHYNNKCMRALFLQYCREQIWHASFVCNRGVSSGSFLWNIRSERH